MRITLAGRVLFVLCAIAAFSTLLALLIQDHSLSSDLRMSAQARLDRSAAMADHLLTAHLQSLAEHYRAVSRSAEFRANVEVGHTPTLSYYADRLAQLEGAAALLFIDRGDRPLGSGGDARVIPAASRALGIALVDFCDLSEGAENRQPFRALATLGLPGFENCLKRVGDIDQVALVVHDGVPHTLSVVPILQEEKVTGRLVALAPLPQKLLARWSELSGTTLSIQPARAPADDDFYRVLRSVGELELRAQGSLDAELRALRTARLNLLTAGCLALAFAFAASVFLARALVRPLRAIQRAIERIGSGDLGGRLTIERMDEFGEVAATFNDMLDQLELTTGRLSKAQRLAHLGSWGLDIDSGVLHYSDEFARIFGLDTSGEPIGMKELASRMHPEDRNRFDQVVLDCVRDGAPFRLDHRVVGGDGTELLIQTQGERLSEDGREVRLEGTAQDITERKLVEDQVRHLAYRDALTGLGNRLLFKERLSLALREASLADRNVGLMFLDIDHFKVINDTLGHSAGDELLKGVADRLVGCVRMRDVATGIAESAVCRLGGDEFTILVMDVRDNDQIGRIAQRVLDALATPFEIMGHEVAIGGSIGITIGPTDGHDDEALLRNADSAMYHAKKKGRNNYQFYTKSMQEAAFKRLNLENKLRGAIERNEFHVFYQPKLELDSGEISGLEALVRWRDPELGFVLPDEFIPLAEETGSILAIGEWVLRTAARQTAEWAREDLPSVRISVNLSPQQIEDPGFVDLVRDILEDTQLDPKQLDLEITESTLMEDEDRASALLGELKALGVSLSLDDFGTGYSSLSYLRSLPIDTLKIDRSFVRRIAIDADDYALTGAIVSMAKVLRLRVVVEGVENEQQRDCLHELGCDEIQGFLFSVPLPADAMAQLMLDHHANMGKVKRKARRRKRGC